MKPVYLLAAFTQAWTSDSPMCLNSPFFRRMTALQKAVVLALSKLDSIVPDLMQNAREQLAPIFYSSVFGELGAMLQLTRAIATHDLPVSPKEFQHSVQNAALAYLSMTHNLHHPCYALSGGFLSADNCLLLAQQRIAHGLDSMGFVIHAHEFLQQDTPENAEAEILLLSADRKDAMLQLAYCREASPADFTDSSLDIFIEGDSKTPPWLLNQGRPSATRIVRSRSGESLVTRWLPIH